MMIDGSVCAQCEGSHAPLCTYETVARRVITTAIVLHPERKSIRGTIRNTGTPKGYHFAQFENSSARLSAIGGVKSPQRHNVHGSRIRMHQTTATFLSRVAI